MDVRRESIFRRIFAKRREDDLRVRVVPTNDIERRKAEFFSHSAVKRPEPTLQKTIFTSDDLLNPIELQKKKFMEHADVSPEEPIFTNVLEQQKKDFLEHVGRGHDPDGTPHSGRFKYNSGKKPYQHEDWFRGFGDQADYYYKKYDGKFNAVVKDLKDQGMTYGDIGKMLGISAKDVQAQASMAKGQFEDYARAEIIKLANENPKMTNQAIGDIVGYGEQRVRQILKENEAGLEKRNATLALAEQLKERVDENGFVDVSEGNSYWIDQTSSRLNTAAGYLKAEGYTLENVGIKQVFGDNYTTMTVLAKPGTTQSDIQKNLDKVVPVFDPQINNEATMLGLDHKPVSIDSSRIAVVYDEQGGTDRDGFIGIRRGVPDLDLGKSNLAQVRIAVDGTHYIKGVAGYKEDDIPPGKDIVIYSNKHEGTPLTSSDPNAKTVLKPMKTDENGNIDEANPFGAMIKSETGQSFYTDKDGNQQLSAINKINEEGDWEGWSGRKYISSQMLSKQPLTIATKQLDLAVDKRSAELENIMNVPNPTIRKKLLNDFADSCDSAAVDLEAAAFPRQQTHVLVPLPKLPANQVYAPNYEDGEHVILIRFPHASIHEIPYLQVNNKDPEGNQIITKNSRDAIGINPKTAAQLSGADYDGDTCLVIPIGDNSKNTSGKVINFNRDKALQSLVEFDPKKEYPYREGMKVMTKQDRGREMGIVTNLITDMTAQGCRDTDQLVRAIKHSMVVIDAEKHKLDYQKSYIDNGIAELHKQWQGRTSGGAKTLIAKAGGKAYVNERKQVGIDPETGEKIFRETGRMTKAYTDKNGVYHAPKLRKQETTKMMKALTTGDNDARSISSGTPMEEAYARYANQCHSLGNKARKAYVTTKDDSKINQSAANAYRNEITSLSRKITEAKKHAPLERQAQILAGAKIKDFERNNPGIKQNDPDHYKKVKTQYLTGARNRFGGGRKRMEVTDKEWEAIDSGAVGKTMLNDVMKYMDSRDLKKHVLSSGSSRAVSDSMKARVQRYASMDYSNATIAEALGLSSSTVSKILAGDI